MNFEKFYFTENEGIHGSRFLILEGGAYGHILHPFEDDTLTFNQLKDMIVKILQGKISATEKVDGMQLSVSFKNGNVIFARNKRQLMNFGENALTSQGLSMMFDGRGKIQEAFAKAGEDLNSGISKLPEHLLRDWFDEGKRFLSLEVIYSDTQNIIPYSSNVLVPHQLIEYDVDGNPIKNDEQSAISIFENIDDDNFVTFKKQMPNLLDLNPQPDRIKEFTSELSRIQDKYRDDDTIGSYKQKQSDYSSLESLILKLGSVALDGCDNLLVNDKTNAINNIKIKITNKIDQIMNSDNVDDIIKLKKQIKRLDNIGGLKIVIPTEGIVFNYNGKKYKLTGTFAPINAIFNLGNRR